MITMNDGMKWRSSPAPGAPLGQFDAQNLPNLEYPIVSDYTTAPMKMGLEDLLTVEHLPSPVPDLHEIVRT